jgi:UPF0755 protein
MSNLKKLMVFGLVIPFFSVSMALGYFYYSVFSWQYKGDKVRFEIKPGEQFSRINYNLSKSKIISSAKSFHRYVQFKGMMTKFKSGVYEIPPQSTMVEVIELLTKGTGITESVTIPEGKNMYEIGKILEKAGFVKYTDFVKKGKDLQFIAELGIEGDSVEGFLFPETYRFTPGSSIEMIVKSMVSQHFKRAKKFDFSKTSLTPFEVITLASIVEKETGAGFERPRIAGVFLNRLKKRMRLQSDPTTIYGIFENFNGNLRKKHLLEKTAYNTYKIPGLPKGPICNPGDKAIEAVLSAERHSFLYFVSQNDGTHVFSKNYSDHNRAVIKFQKTSRNRRGKSWRNLKKE